MSDFAPIVLFIYNRPEHTRRTLDALAANPLAAESDLIVFSDGPKNARDAVLVRKVRALIQSVEGFRNIKLRPQDGNVGLAQSIIKGVSEVCSEFGRAIVLEDDLVVASNFLEFMNGGLERYEGSPQVHQVSGYLFPGCEGEGHPRFLPLTTTWGWATWDRAWRQFDKEASSIVRLRSDSAFRNRFDLNGAYNYSGMVEQQLTGAIDSWGVRWYLSVFAQDGLTLYPGQSLVENIGLDGSGTHGAGHAELYQKSIAQDFGLGGWPQEPVIDQKCLVAIEELLRSMHQARQNRPLIQRLKAWLEI